MTFSDTKITVTGEDTKASNEEKASVDRPAASKTYLDHFLKSGQDWDGKAFADEPVNAVLMTNKLLDYKCFPKLYDMYLQNTTTEIMVDSLDLKLLEKNKCRKYETTTNMRFMQATNSSKKKSDLISLEGFVVYMDNIPFKTNKNDSKEKNKDEPKGINEDKNKDKENDESESSDDSLNKASKVGSKPIPNKKDNKLSASSSEDNNEKDKNISEKKIKEPKINENKEKNKDGKETNEVKDKSKQKNKVVSESSEDDLNKTSKVQSKPISNNKNDGNAGGDDKVEKDVNKSDTESNDEEEKTVTENKNKIVEEKGKDACIPCQDFFKSLDRAHKNQPKKKKTKREAEADKKSKDDLIDFVKTKRENMIQRKKEIDDKLKEEEKENKKKLQQE